MKSGKNYNRKIVSIVPDALLSCEQRIIKKNYRTFLESLSDFGFGQHAKQQEQVDLAKQILAGMARAEELSKDDADILAKEYPEFFEITQFFQSSYRARQGNFLEKAVALVLPLETIACNLNPKYLVSFIVQPARYYQNDVLKELTVKEENLLKAINKYLEISFSKEKFAKAKADHVSLLEVQGGKVLTIAELRSTDVTGGTSAAQSNFEKMNLFMKEIDVKDENSLPVIKGQIGKRFAKLVREEVEDIIQPKTNFIDAIAALGVTDIHFIAGILFNNDGTLATPETDSQLSAKRNEFEKVLDDVQKLADKPSSPLEISEDFDRDEAIDRLEFSCMLRTTHSEIHVTLSCLHGEDYLRAVAGNDEISGSKFLDSFLEISCDDLWMLYKVVETERRIRAQYSANHIEKVREWLLTNQEFQEEYSTFREKVSKELFLSCDEIWQSVYDLTTKFTLKYIDTGGWNQLSRITDDTTKRVHYLKNVFYFLIIADFLGKYSLSESRKLVISETADLFYTITRKSPTVETTSEPKDKEFNFRRLCSEVPNTTYLTHGIHAYPAKFIPQIPRYIIKNFSERGDTILDPFCGAGTSLVEANLLMRNAYGIDINPLSELLVKVKTRVIPSISRFVDEVMENLGNIRESSCYITPRISNLDFWFAEKPKRELGQIFGYLENNKNEISDDVYDFLLVCASATVRKVSNADPKISKPFISKYMRELIETNRLDTDTFKHFNKIVNQYIERVIRFSKEMWKVEKYYGVLPFSKFLTDCDARFMRKLKAESIDCIVTSPPYANAQEYFRSMKLELFWLGFADEEKLRELNRELIGTERIDPDESKKLHQTGISELDNAIARIYAQDKRRSAIVWRYFEDMKQNFRECFRVLKPGRHFAILVGDNVIRKVPVTTHKYLIEIGEEIGFKLIDVGYDKIVARSLSPKRNESAGLINVEWMLIFKKP